MLRADSFLPQPQFPSPARLVRILERKFGPLPPAYQQRILTAGPDDIWRWVDRALSAEALEQIFD